MMLKKILLYVCLAGGAAAVACSGSGPSGSPTTPSGPGSPLNPDGSNLKIAAPGLNAPANGFTFPGIFQDQVTTLTVNNVNGTYTTFPVTIEFEVRNAANAVIANPKVAAAAGPTTSTTIASSALAGDTTYTWRARATYNNATGPWAAARSFRTALAAGCSGQTCIDPLTIGQTFGKAKGGQFIPGQGWQAKSVVDGIDYDIPTLASGIIEFDITNIGKVEGVCCNADLKFLSMGDRNNFGDFNSFRDHPWKMHLVQRADGDGTGLEIIWRNGGTEPDGNPGDHRIKMTCCGPDFRNSSVFHFIVKWSPAGYNISVGVNGGAQQEYLADGFGGRAYAPPNHRVSLGCYPRSETIIGAIYRNVTIRPN